MTSRTTRLKALTAALYSEHNTMTIATQVIVIVIVTIILNHFACLIYSEKFFCMAVIGSVAAVIIVFSSKRLV